MIQYYKKEGDKIVECDRSVENCWLNIYPPFNHEKLEKLSRELNIPFDFLIDSIDIDERSRFEIEEGVELIVIKTPIINEVGNEFDALFVTIPIGIIVLENLLITISPAENPVIDSFLENKVKNFNPFHKSLFVLQLFQKNVYYFLHYLKEINYRRNDFEKELYNSMRNEELTKLLNIEKSLVYFVTSLRANELMMLKLQRLDILKIRSKEKETEMLEDVIIDNSQALEMANIYTNILSGTMDAFASIISNNLNFVMKRLTSVTIVLMLPTLVASFYGMNVDLPLQDTDHAFIYTLVFSFILSAGLVWVFFKKRWF